MTLGRTAVGLAVRAVRESAAMTLEDLAKLCGMTSSSLSRTENGLRAAEFAEIVKIAEAAGVPVSTFLDLAQSFEREGVSSKARKRDKLSEDLDRLQREAVKVAVQAKALGH